MSGMPVLIGGRGTLQPAKPQLDGVKCERCGCYWIPDEECFGCPGCELREAVEKAGWLDDPA